MTLIDLFFLLAIQSVIGVIIHKTIQNFRKTKAEVENPRHKASWSDPDDVVEKMEARFKALQKREFEARERCWVLEDENTVLRFKLIDLQKRLAGEPPDQPNFHDDEDDEE